MSRYAEGTSVPVERSRAEIERDLTRYGASHFGYTTGPEGAQLGFEVRGTRVRLAVAYPPLVKFARTPTGRVRAGGCRAQADARDAELRRLWRALALVIKAKLEAIGSGISTLEREFMADVVMPDGRTLGEAVLPRLAEVVSTGRLLPAPRAEGEGGGDR